MSHDALRHVAKNQAAKPQGPARAHHDHAITGADVHAPAQTAEHVLESRILVDAPVGLSHDSPLSCLHAASESPGASHLRSSSSRIFVRSSYVSDDLITYASADQLRKLSL